MHMEMYGDHGGAIVALLYLPVVLVGLALAVDRAAAARSALARRNIDGFAATGGTRRILVLLLAMTAAVHLGLIPGHVDEDRVLAALFALDFVALAGVALAGFDARVPLWRAAVTVLLVANLVAYAGYVAAGIETVDAIGIATKAIEVAALILVIHPASAFVEMGERGSRRLETIKQRRIV